MVCSVQVAEDSDSNLVHLLSEVRNGKSYNTTMLIQTENGVQSSSTGLRHLKGKVRHRFTGTYDGTKEDYRTAAQNSGYNGVYKRRSLEKIGVRNLKKGFGALIDVATLGNAALNSAQMFHLWNTFSADGILTPEEIVRMGVEMTEFNNVGSAVREIHTAITEDGVDLVTAAEIPGPIDSVLGAGFENAQSIAEDTGDAVSGLGELIGGLLESLFS